MKAGWEYKKLGEIATFARGLTYSKNDEVERSNNIVLRSNNIDLFAGKLDFSELKYLKADFVIPEDKRLRKGSLFICMSNGSKAHLGKVAYVDKDYGYAFGGFMGQITPSNDVDGLYLHYALSSPLYKEYIKSLSEGANINNLKYKDLAEFIIKFPSLAEQQSIVDYLDSAFAKIDAMKANAEKALNEAKALFQASLKEMLEPKEGWEEKLLGDIVFFFSGYAFESKRYTNNNDDVLLICGDNIVHCDFRWETIKHWPKAESEDLKRFSLEENDIVLAMDRPWVKSGLKIAQISPKELPSLLIQRTACIRVPKDISSNFIFYTLQTDNFIKYLVSLQTGVGVPHISGKQILSYKSSIPKYTEQQSIVETLDSLKSKVDRLQENFDKISQECDALKQAILRQVFE